MRGMIAVEVAGLTMKMRAGLALALIYRPEMLFLDEPTIGLDVTAAAAIRARFDPLENLTTLRLVHICW